MACGQTRNNHFNRAGKPCDGITVARIVNQYRVHQSLKCDFGTPPWWDIAQIFCQTPTCIERRAQCRDRDPAHQRLKAEKRCHGPEFVSLIQRCNRAYVVQTRVASTEASILPMRRPASTSGCGL